MPDEKVNGKLVVTDQIGIGIEEPIAQLHITSSTPVPSQTFLESGGALLKLSVDASGAAIGTDNAFPLSIKTDDTPRISIDKIGNISLSGALSVQNSLTVSGSVGIGTTTPPTTKLEVAGTVKATSFQGDGSSLGGVVKKAGDTMTGALTVNNTLTVSGNVGIGTTITPANLDVNGTVKAITFQGDGSGLTGLVGTTQWSNGANGSIYYNSGNVGIGITTPSHTLDVSSSSSEAGIHITNTGTGSPVLRFRKGSTPVNKWGLFVSLTGSDDKFYLWDYGANTARMILDTSGNINFAGTVKVNGQTVIDSDASWHRSYGNAGWYNGTYGGGWYMEDSTWIRSYGGKNIYHDTGILRTDGTLQVGPNGNRFVVDISGNVGIGTTNPQARLHAVASSGGAAVSGVSDNIGVYAYNSSYGNTAYLGTRCCAADFYGEVYCHNHITKAGGGFKIDHPLEPARKYLYHSFVESPDMKNIYDGVATLDANGEAVVNLPDWFEVLNKDFRYQLTCIGGYAPVYIAQEISGNCFKIAGGSPGMKVSWQLTGIRQDAWANANRLPVEEEKIEEERDYYLHPVLHGESEERSLRWIRHPNPMQPVQQMQQNIPAEEQPR
ncbi:MAG TPA: shufflon system plasmid conjugative transfer pilus tip adhesin PilV [Allocoleopsis sp.]